MAIIKSRWETDAYKLSMGQVFWQKFPSIWARYEVRDRNNLSYPANFANRLREEVDSLANLPAHIDRVDYVKQKWPFMDRKFLNWYANEFRYNPKQVQIKQEDNKISVVVEGPLAEATHWEIPLLRIIACLYTEMTERKPRQGWIQEAKDRATFFMKNNVAWSEFGGRRPFSEDVHWNALVASSEYKQPEKGKGGLIGTSWVEYAYQLGLMLIGTQAHEFTSAMGGIYGHENANRKAMQIWIETYGTRLGYVLPDTYTTTVFLRDFVHGYADLFEGSRQDSGNSFKYVEQLLAHYREVDVDARSKSIIHSNSLRDIKDILALNNYRPGDYLRSFGLGGMITNNCGWPAFNIIAKLFAINIGDGVWIPTVKIPDDPGKAVGDRAVISEVMKRLNIHY